jgi:hypothetical protein
MTDTRSWWPTGYGDEPAFQVRRIVYGTVTGGDYARGSSVLALPKTALRFPTAIAGAAEAVGRATLHVRVKNHYVRQEPVYDDHGIVQRYIDWPVGDIEIMWGWPAAIEDVWTDVALVRSAFGRPSTVNDGQTIMLAKRDAFYQRNSQGVVTTGDDGLPVLAIPPIVTDTDLPTGRWYHYGLFFKVSEVQWLQGMLDSTLLPRDFRHAEHLWNNVPPYYRWADENMLATRGHLQQFLSVFGFELDTAREYVESWQHVYDVDWSPIRLLRKLGPNFGYPYEQGIGDIRYRSLFSEIGRFYEIRGTQECLEGVVQRTSKYGCDVTSGSNVMILPDDSDFYAGAGNWGVVLDTTDAPGSGYLAKDKVTIAPASLSFKAPPTGIGRRALSIYTAAADATTDIGIACGDSYVSYDPETGLPEAGTGVWKTVTPDRGGIPIDPDMSYGFSAWIQSRLTPTAVQLSLLFFDGHNNLISASSSPINSVTSDNTWQEFSIGTVVVPPAGAVYVVPYILFDTRSTSGSFPVTSPTLFLAGAMVYAAATIGEAIGPPPNRYLTVGDPGEVLGDDLKFKGTLTGAGTSLPTGAAVYDAYVLTPAPIPTAAPNFLGVTPSRAAAVNDTLYWNGTAWINAGPLPDTWLPFLLGSPS